MLEPHSISDVARILGISRPTVEQRVDQGVLAKAPGSGPARISGDSLLAEVDRLIQELAERLVHLCCARAAIANDDHPSLGGRDQLVQALVDRAVAAERENQREKLGRAAAELRIDELKRDLNRANAAIDALQIPSEYSIPSPGQG